MKGKNKLKQNTGFTGVDLTVAVLILILFVSLITTLFYNIYLTSNATKRSTVANSYLVNILEQIECMEYSEIIEDSKVVAETDTLLDTIKAKVTGNDKEIIRGVVTEGTTATKPYTIGISIVNYNETKGNTNKEDLVKQIQVTIRYKVGKKVEIKEMKRTKTKEIGTQDSLGVIPKIAEGMKPVKWVEDSSGGYWQVTSKSDPEWFDYSKKKWANIMLQDGLTTDETGKVLTMGSMFVYIPRFAYQIPAVNYHTAVAGTIGIKFLSINNECLDGSATTIQTTVTSSVAGTSINATTHYILHPAFTFGGRQLAGIWMSKFEASNPGCNQQSSSGEVAYGSITNRKVQVKPGVTSWRNISVDNMFAVCRNMVATDYSYYGFKTANLVDSHMMKNIEWGAAAYLSQSQYGKQNEVFANNNNNYITGMSATTLNQASNNSIDNSYDTQKGKEASTTGNIYGIYDMRGGAWEVTAGYLTENTSNIYVTYFNSLDDKYKDKYAGTGTVPATNFNYNNKKYGDATWETASELNSWNGGYMSYLSNTNEFFARGGRYVDTAESGIFSVGKYMGNNNNTIGFRPVIIM